MARYVSGVQDMLKDGSKYLSGVDEAVLKNIENCKKLSQISRTSLGPNGMNKMVINHLDKLLVTNDAATMLKEMEVVHPAAKMIVIASQKQADEMGDATNLVVVFAGELLEQAEALLKTGLHPSEVIAGYTKAWEQLLQIAPELSVENIESVRNEAALRRGLKTTLAAKLYSREDILARLVTEASLLVMPKNVRNFNVDNIRVAKIPGSGLADSYVVKGFAIIRDVEGTIKRVSNAKVAVITCQIDVAGTETKGTALLKSGKELEQYSIGEEQILEKNINSIAATGVNVVVCGSSISDLAMHFFERNKMMVLKVPSKFDLRRICKTVGAIALVRVGAPTPEEIGECEEVSVAEIASTKVTIFRQEKEDSQVSTIILRGSTMNLLDDIERAVDDGVNLVKQIARDGNFVPGAGAFEIEVARRLSSFADSTPGLEQYAIRKFAEALEVIPRTLAENAGLTATDVISSLYAAHSAGETTKGVNIEGEGGLVSTQEAGILDHLQIKLSALRLATDAAVTILRVNQIIMSKPAGGPKVPNQGAVDGDD
eukprot:TRINITY_DN447_c0_g2_i1.p1 TRINITY_DN447_c0_g2~~TRINITY_DN447_c0_g2_i1.p1  ORF type:complete len:543 (+),score=155.84 TRINITY_DN447_c0_g2_i1:72-1700(+)